MGSATGKDLDRHPIIVLIGAIAGLIAIFAFLTGYENLPEIFQQRQNPSGFYDDFNDSAYDGKYNSKLWAYTGTGRVEMSQQDGVMVFTTKPVLKEGNNKLSPVKPESWAYSRFRLMEAKLKLDGSQRGQGSFIKIQAVAVLEENYGWWVECQLKNSENDLTLYFCNVYSGEGWDFGSGGYEYETRSVKGDYDTWYTARFEFDPDTAEIKFFLNDNLIGSHVPRDAERIKTAKFFPQIGSWTGADERFTGYFDDVRIGK